MGAQPILSLREYDLRLSSSESENKVDLYRLYRGSETKVRRTSTTSEAQRMEADLLRSLSATGGRCEARTNAQALRKRKTESAQTTGSKSKGL